MKKTTVHKFVYTKEDIANLIKEDIVNLIKGDIASKMGMKTIPIVFHSIYFDLKSGPPDDSPGFPQYFFDGAKVEVEVPG